MPRRIAIVEDDAAIRALAPSLPILFLTARDSDFDAVSGLRLGADDYLTKDVSLPHLLARISALFRRIDALREPKAAEEVLERGALRSEEHTSELQSRLHLVCRLLLEKKKQ